MSLQLKLKDSAIEVLMGLLQPKEMIAIYLLGIGKTEPQKFHNQDLIKIIIVLCEKLCWIEDEKSDDLSEKLLRDVDIGRDPSISIQKVQPGSSKKWPVVSHPDPEVASNKHLSTSPRTQQSPTDNLKSQPKYESEKEETNDNDNGK